MLYPNLDKPVILWTITMFTFAHFLYLDCTNISNSLHSNKSNFGAMFAHVIIILKLIHFIKTRLQNTIGTVITITIGISVVDLLGMIIMIESIVLTLSTLWCYREFIYAQKFCTQLFEVEFCRGYCKCKQSKSWKFGCCSLTLRNSHL